MAGRVEQINVTETEGGTIRGLPEATVIAGEGIEGDRYVVKARETGDPVAPLKQLTLIEAEALEALARDYGLELSAADSRRNVCTRGVSLDHLVGREFRVGVVRAKGVELCEPCGTMERLSGVTGSCKGMIHRGGLRAEVLEGGTIRIGDAVAEA
jgi:MOSC domain-containing protein YiiM